MRRVALLGNPNVGKSTIFNALTGMRQHTGNWAGVTVSCVSGTFEVNGIEFSVVDLPGIYSFDTRSEEEAVTKRFVESLDYDVLVLICDATCLERGLHLLSQTTSLLQKVNQGTPPSPQADQDAILSPQADQDATPSPQADQDATPLPQADQHATPSPQADLHVTLPQLVLCVNLCDEAAKKGIILDFPTLENELKIPVIPCCARERGGLERLKEFLSSTVLRSDPQKENATITFSPPELAAQAVCYTNINYRKREETLDRIFTGRITGTLCMLLLLTGVFWLTITGANYPSSLLWELFFRFETILVNQAIAVGLPDWFIGAAIFGIYRVVAWIVSVMLPPMAIFFPLFTLMEDFGLLPRIAYNMDGAFHSCGACGKQCLTMAMGLGCNAAGVTGCRIIDSPRERLIAILTNSLVPCNGRFPLLITMISLCAYSFSETPIYVSSNTQANVSDSISHAVSGNLPVVFTNLLIHLIPALALTGFILLGIAATLGISYLLSRTVLKGLPSSFTLELPPYRRPQIRKVLVRSIFDRTLFVLGRAVAVAAPAGLCIWLMANIMVNGNTLLQIFSGFLDPLGRLMGLDGVILMAFILGFPANEIVLPIILMAYMQSGTLIEMEDSSVLFTLLSAHGWTLKTFLCMAVFSLFHWPCSTTCLTIKKETGSWYWTAAAFLLPTLTGFLLCIAISLLSKVPI